MPIETDRDRVRVLAVEKEEENWEFRSFLKNNDLSTMKLDRMVHRHYEEVTREIDCQACANCCVEVSPLLSEEDVRRLADYLKMEPEDLIAMYIQTDEEDEGYEFRESPCPFLEDNLCRVYDARPSECRSFPHLHKDEFIRRLIQAVQNCSICPIVYNVFERLKNDLWHSRF